MTKNFAHRGFSAAYPENTMLAFQKAYETGCHGLEMDVHLSRDGVPVILHDETVDRTTNGSGWVFDMTAAQLRELDASYRFAGQMGHNPIPTLEEVLDWAKDTGLILNLELKTNVNQYPGIEKKVIDMVCRFGMQERVILSSFNHETLLRCKALAPNIPCGALTESWIVDFDRYLAALGIECAHPEHWYLTDEHIARLKEKGIRINTWTVNDPAIMQRLIEKEVEILITNHPDVLHRLLQP